jgi:DNA-binding transcriptional ArsR family regulator
MTKASLPSLGIPAATAKLATYFARNGSARPTIRELQRTLGAASASVQRDLERLVAAGALTMAADGRSVRYRADPRSSLWQAVRLLLGDELPGSDDRTRVREQAVRFGVDIGQLRSMLRLTAEERLVQLDANASFLKAVRKTRRPSKPKGRR